jgi:hypothetical protein
MHYRAWLAGAVLLSGCAKTTSAPASARTSAGPDETFACVKKQIGALGYKQTSIDVDKHRISASKIDPKARRADTQFRRVLDKLEVEVAAEADGQTSIKATGHTFAEYTTQRGPTEVEEKASDEVRSATQQLLERCRS